MVNNLNCYIREKTRRNFTIDIKEKIKEKLLNLEELKKVSAGTGYESMDLCSEINANPYLADCWNNALYQAYEWEPDDENFCFLAAQIVLSSIGISCMMFDDNGSPDANRYSMKSNSAPMSHQQAVEYIRNCKDWFHTSSENKT